MMHLIKLPDDTSVAVAPASLLKKILKRTISIPLSTLNAVLAGGTNTINVYFVEDWGYKHCATIATRLKAMEKTKSDGKGKQRK